MKKIILILMLIMITVFIHSLKIEDFLGSYIQENLKDILIIEKDEIKCLNIITIKYYFEYQNLKIEGEKLFFGDGYFATLEKSLIVNPNPYGKEFSEEIILLKLHAPGKKIYYFRKTKD